jgi:uncharacterized protein
MIASRVVRHAFSVVLALGVPTVAPSAWAQQPSAEAIASAKEILDLKGSNLLYDSVIPRIVEQAKNVFLQTSPMLGKDLNDVAAQLRKEMAFRQLEVAEEITKAYASRFTEQELKEIANFYRSPVGRKVIFEEPKLLELAANAIQRWAGRLSDEILEKFRTEMKKKGHDL